jgi:dihydrodipicolinate synthase/N-acetylneuraminate lyase
MAQDLGADAVMIAPSKEPVPNDERVIEMYQQATASLRIPVVLQDHPASTDVHMSVTLIGQIIAAVPRIACIKEESVPTAPKIRQLRDAIGDKAISVLSGLGALYAPFDLEAGSDGFNTGFAFPEVLIAMVRAARASDWARVHAIYSRFSALIVFEQQTGRGHSERAVAAARPVGIDARSSPRSEHQQGCGGMPGKAARPHPAWRRCGEAVGDRGDRRRAITLTARRRRSRWGDPAGRPRGGVASS